MIRKATEFCYRNRSIPIPIRNSPKGRYPLMGNILWNSRPRITCQDYIAFRKH